MADSLFSAGLLSDFVIPHNRLGIRCPLEDLPYGAIFRHDKFTFVKGRVEWHKRYGKGYRVYPTPLQSPSHRLCSDYFCSAQRKVEYIYHPCSSVAKVEEPLLFE